MQRGKNGRRDMALLTVCLMLALTAAPARAQQAATAEDIVDQLVVLDATADVDVAALRQQVLDRVKSKANAVSLRRPPIPRPR